MAATISECGRRAVEATGCRQRRWVVAESYAEDDMAQGGNVAGTGERPKLLLHVWAVEYI